MFRFISAILAAFSGLALNASAQLLTNASLTGTYNFRYVGVNTSPADTALSYSGTIAFSGTTDANGYGTFTVSGQGANAAAGPPANNIYAVLSSGLVFINNPFDVTGNTFLFGGIGSGILNASSTDSNYCDLLIAVPVASGASSATLSGNYWIASLDFLGGNFAQTRNTFFSATADGKGGLGNVSINGTALNIGATAQTQTSTGATYTLSSNGTGTMTFPAPSGVASANQLLSGAKNLIASQDGSFFAAGGQSGYDIIVGVKAISGNASTAASGLYFVGYLENQIYSDGTNTIFGADGAADEVSSLAVEIGHQRTQPDSADAFDNSYAVSFMPGSNGTVSYTDSNYAVGAGGNVIIGSGAGSNFQLTVYNKAPSLSGTGVFLNPQGLVNAASNTPFTAGVSPGEFLTLFGNGMAAQTTTASALPFPTTLGGIQVGISWFDQNGNPQSAQAPLYAVSPTQISLVVPYTTPGDGTLLNFTVSNGSSQSNIASVYSGPSSPGIFTIPAGGIGNGAILHADFSVVSSSSPAKVGETVQIFMTGLGATTPAVTAGAAGPTSPLAQTLIPDVYIDGVQATVVFAGLAPTLGGVYQLNVTIPSGVTTNSTDSIEIDTFDEFNDLEAVNFQATIPISQ